MSQITTLTFFRFDDFAGKFFAFRMMQFAHRHLSAAAGQTFYKLMGSGKGAGFNPWPDWSTYALLQVWEDISAADSFFENAPVFEKYQRRASGITTYFMRSITAHGAWSGGNPFVTSPELDPAIEKIAVITRATIKFSRLRDFWSFVPRSQSPLENGAPGLLYTKGVGEVPIVQMATFSIWQSASAMKEYAYKSPEHREAIAKTRELGWYKEELFARFQPFLEINHGS